MEAVVREKLRLRVAQIACAGQYTATGAQRQRMIRKHTYPVAMFAGIAAAAISLASPSAAFANSGQDRWGGIVFFCSPPIPAQSWGVDACAFVAEEAAKKAAELNLPLVDVAPDKAGIAGGPDDGVAPFPWPKALRLLAKYDATISSSYPWSLTLVFYEYPADANGEYAENRWQAVYQQSATLLDGKEFEGTKETSPIILNGTLDRLFGGK